ncbi:MAG: hypothetical protein H5T60_02640 [Anaerolineae bacterium]|nr:hypothetical protein [Anaerolineae bacterium]
MMERPDTSRISGRDVVRTGQGARAGEMRGRAGKLIDPMPVLTLRDEPGFHA